MIYDFCLRKLKNTTIATQGNRPRIAPKVSAVIRTANLQTETAETVAGGKKYLQAASINGGSCEKTILQT